MDIARRLPQAERDRVDAVIAAAGPTVAGALAVLAEAVARIVVERCASHAHPAIFGGVTQRVSQAVILLTQTRGRG
jgi:hypothetical protein